MSKLMEMSNTVVVMKKMADKIYVSVAAHLPTSFILVCALEETASEALQRAFYDFAQELNDKKAWNGTPLPKRHEPDDIVLYDSVGLDFLEYENTHDNKITCTIKMGPCATVATAISYQSATYLVCEKLANYFINKL